MRRGLAQSVANRKVTLLKHKGKLYCIDSTCYHTGGPLGVGEIEEMAGKTCIKCPWHSYLVTLDEGGKLYESLVMGPDKKLVSGGLKMKTQAQRVHAVERRADGVYIRLHTEGMWDSDQYCTTAMKTPSETLSLAAGSSGPVPGSGSSSLHSSLPSVTGKKVVAQGASAPTGQMAKGPFKTGFDRPQRSGHVLNAPKPQGQGQVAPALSASPLALSPASQPLPPLPLSGDSAAVVGAGASVKGASGVAGSGAGAGAGAGTGGTACRRLLAAGPAAAPDWREARVVTNHVDGSAGSRLGLRLGGDADPAASRQAHAAWLASLGRGRSLGVQGASSAELLRAVVHVELAVTDAAGALVARSFTPLVSPLRLAAELAEAEQQPELKPAAQDLPVLELGLRVNAQGQLTPLLARAVPGATVLVSPAVVAPDALCGAVAAPDIPNMADVDELFLLGGGSGGAPLLQVLQAAKGRAAPPAAARWKVKLVLYNTDPARAMLLDVAHAHAAHYSNTELVAAFAQQAPLAAAAGSSSSSSNNNCGSNNKTTTVFGVSFLDVAFLKTVGVKPGGARQLFVLCGSPAFMQQLPALLEDALQVPPSSIALFL